MNIITRDIINKDIKVYNPFANAWQDYNSLCSKIDQIKNTLISRGAKPGDSVALIQVFISLNHMASVFACLELGLKLIVADMPATKESLPYCKIALRGPTKFTLYDSDIFTFDFEKYDGRAWRDMIFNYGGHAISEKEYDNVFDPTPIWATEDSIGLVSSSSGTTDWSKAVDFTQKEIYSIAHRNIKLFNYQKSDIVVQTKNLHHGGSLLISFLPSVITCDKHISAFIADYKNHFDTDSNKAFQTQLIKIINHMQCNRITITNYDIFESFLELVGDTIGKFSSPLIIIPFVFKSSPRLIELAKKHNVEIHNTYGSIDSQMIPLSINKITKDSVYEEDYVGDWINDEFYKIHSIDQRQVHTFERQDGKLCTIHDSIEIKNGKVYLYARAVDENLESRQQVEKYISVDFSIVQNGNDKYLALFEETTVPQEVIDMNFKNILVIDKTLFYGEAKINYDALRGHFIATTNTTSVANFYDLPHIFVVFRPGSGGNFISGLLDSLLCQKFNNLKFSESGHAHYNNIVERKQAGKDYLSFGSGLRFVDPTFSTVEEKIKFYKSGIDDSDYLNQPYVTWSHAFENIPIYQSLFPNGRIITINEDTLRERLTTLIMHVNKNHFSNDSQYPFPATEQNLIKPKFFKTMVIKEVFSKAYPGKIYQPGHLDLDLSLMYAYFLKALRLEKYLGHDLSAKIPYDDNGVGASTLAEKITQFSIDRHNVNLSATAINFSDISAGSADNIIKEFETILKRQLSESESYNVTRLLDEYVRSQNSDIISNPKKYLSDMKEKANTIVSTFKDQIDPV